MSEQINRIDLAAHEIGLMLEFAIRASETLVGSDRDKDKFEMPGEDADLLHFSLFDIVKRLKALRAILNEPAKTTCT